MQRVALSVARLEGVVACARHRALLVMRPWLKRHFSSFTKRSFNSSVEAPHVSSSGRARNKSGNQNLERGHNSLEKKTVEALHALEHQDEDVHGAINLKNGKQNPRLFQTVLKKDTSPDNRLSEMFGSSILPVTASALETERTHNTEKDVTDTPLKENPKGTSTTLTKRKRTPKGNESVPLDTNSDDRTEKAQMEILQTLERIVIEDPNCLTYPLHTFDHIPDTFVNSFRAYRQLLVCRTVHETSLMKKLTCDLNDIMNTEVLGKVFYFRVELEPRSSDPSDGTLDDVRKALRDKVLGKIKHLLMDYTIRVLELHEGEVTCDVTHYTNCAPLIAACKANVAQFVRDAHCLMTSSPLDREGIAGETPAEVLLPLSIEEVAKDVAARISREIIQPLLSCPEGGDADEARLDDARAVRVFFGIAPTPALAKIACDAEVATWRRQHSNHGESAPAARKSKTPASSNTSTSKVAVRVRSFYSHLQTVEDGKKFMANFRVAHIPIFTPAFAKFLYDVFGIETCSDIYDRREELHFSLSKETFKACYCSVFGRMRYPVEDRVMLFGLKNLVNFNYMVKDMATNNISIVNATRTGTRHVLLNTIVSHSPRTDEPLQLKSYLLRTVDSKLVYGRLFTEEQFVEAVLRGVTKGHELLIRKTLTASGLRVVVRSGNEIKRSISCQFSATDDLETLKEVARAVALELAPYRQHKCLENSDDPSDVHVYFHSLNFKQMIPDRLQMEFDTIKQDFLSTVESLRKFGYWRLKNKSKPQKKKQTQRMIEFGLNTKKEIDGQAIEPNVSEEIERIVEV
ncbi:unnamed protein product [Phytomonas sp. EM1]|nr:unnamed protein product [Phytomonas sp. EM1]|eukprot:CCW62339.1 unnamed protein product [Phytomonas sp. isolate EM1]